MLLPIDNKVCEALVNLEHNGNFKIIMDWIKASGANTTEELAVAVDVKLYRAQGAYGVLHDLHTHASEARTTLLKLSSGSK